MDEGHENIPPPHCGGPQHLKPNSLGVAFGSSTPARYNSNGGVKSTSWTPCLLPDLTPVSKFLHSKRRVLTDVKSPQFVNIKDEVFPDFSFDISTIDQSAVFNQYGALAEQIGSCCDLSSVSSVDTMGNATEGSVKLTNQTTTGPINDSFDCHPPGPSKCNNVTADADPTGKMFALNKTLDAEDDPAELAVSEAEPCSNTIESASALSTNSLLESHTSVDQLNPQNTFDVDCSNLELNHQTITGPMRVDPDPHNTFDMTGSTNLSNHQTTTGPMRVDPDPHNTFDMDCSTNLSNHQTTTSPDPHNTFDMDCSTNLSNHQTNTSPDPHNTFDMTGSTNLSNHQITTSLINVNQQNTFDVDSPENVTFDVHLPVPSRCTKDTTFDADAVPEDVPVVAVSEDVPLVVVSEDVPVVAVPEDVPVVAVPEDVPVVAVPEDVPVVAVPEDVPVVAVPEDVPVVAVPEDEPVVAVSEDEPVVAVSEDEPVVAVSEDEPVVAVPEDEPVVEVPENEPVVAVPEDEPVVAVSEDEPGLVAVSEDEPVVAVSEDEPVVAVSEDEPGLVAVPEDEPGLVAVPEDEPVVAVSEDEQGLVAVSEDEPVVAVPEDEPVVAVPEDEPVVAASEDEAVVAVSEDEAVVAVSEDEPGLVAVPEDEPVVAVPEDEPVVAVPEDEPVVAVSEDELGLVAVTEDEPVVRAVSATSSGSASVTGPGNSKDYSQSSTLTMSESYDSPVVNFAPGASKLDDTLELREAQFTSTPMPHRYAAEKVEENPTVVPRKLYQSHSQFVPATNSVESHSQFVPPTNIVSDRKTFMNPNDPRVKHLLPPSASLIPGGNLKKPSGLPMRRAQANGPGHTAALPKEATGIPRSVTEVKGIPKAMVTRSADTVAPAVGAVLPAAGLRKRQGAGLPLATQRAGPALRPPMTRRLAAKVSGEPTVHTNAAPAIPLLKIVQSPKRRNLRSGGDSSGEAALLAKRKMDVQVPSSSAAGPSQTVTTGQSQTLKRPASRLAFPGAKQKKMDCSNCAELQKRLEEALQQLEEVQQENKRLRKRNVLSTSH